LFSGGVGVVDSNGTLGVTKPSSGVRDSHPEISERINHPNTDKINQKMKMVRHKAPRQYIRKWNYMMLHLSDEKQIIITCKKYLLTIIALIVDMVNMSRFKNHLNA
jgi:hypothetical protein